jgi:hypothetical protein
MARYMKKTLINILLTSAIASLLVGCSMQKSHEKAAQEKAAGQGLSAIDNAQFDGTFVAPGVSFSQYRRIQIEPLNMNNVEILRSSSRPGTLDTPWVLNDADKEFYQLRYLDSINRYLLSDNRFVTTPDVAEDVLLLQSRITQIAPLASKDDSVGRPGLVKSYSEGMGTMTLEMTLYDASSGKAIAIITDRRDLGSLWGENNRATNAVQVRNAFNAWLKRLRTELDVLAAR